MKLQKLYRYVRQAADEYNLIEDGDKIAVAVSGGKDSLALLYALAGLKRFYPASFTICAITLILALEWILRLFRGFVMNLTFHFLFVIRK